MRSLQRLSVLVAATASVALFAGTAAQSSGEIIGLWDFEEFATHNELQSGPFANHAPASSMATASTLSNVGIGARVALTSTLDGVFGPLPSMMYAPSAGGFNKAAPVAADDYLGFSLTSAQSGLALSDFTFDLGVSNNSTAVLDPGGKIYTVKAQLFYSTDAGATFNAIGDLFELTADNANDEGAWTGISTFQVDLSSLSPLDAGDTVEFRLGVSGNRGTGLTSLGSYWDNLTVSAVPEPASLGLLGVAGLGLIRRRRMS